jgi:hypothetical protein
MVSIKIKLEKNIISLQLLNLIGHNFAAVCMSSQFDGIRSLLMEVKGEKCKHCKAAPKE